MIDILLVNGSVNPFSKTKRLLNTLSKFLQKKGYTTKVIDVVDLNIPIFNPSNSMPDSIQEIWLDMLNSKAFIIGSPEYHGGYSGALKNFIDHLNSSIFLHKPLGLVVSTGGLKSGVNTLNSLRIIFRSLYANVIPEQVTISEKEYVNDELNSPEIQRLLAVGNGLHHYLKKLEVGHQMDY